LPGASFNQSIAVWNFCEIVCLIVFQALPASVWIFFHPSLKNWPTFVGTSFSQSTMAWPFSCNQLTIPSQISDVLLLTSFHRSEKNGPTVSVNHEESASQPSVSSLGSGRKFTAICPSCSPTHEMALSQLRFHCSTRVDVAVSSVSFACLTAFSKFPMLLAAESKSSPLSA